MAMTKSDRAVCVRKRERERFTTAIGPSRPMNTVKFLLLCGPSVQNFGHFQISSLRPLLAERT